MHLPDDTPLRTAVLQMDLLTAYRFEIEAYNRLVGTDEPMLMEQVTLRGRGDENLDTAPVRVTVRGGGVEESIDVDWAPGSLADPFTREQLLDKWRACARHGGLDVPEAEATPLLDAPLDAPAAQVLTGFRARVLAATRPGVQA